MKRIKSVLLLLAIWGALPVSSWAQQVSPPQLERLLENRQVLQLTDAQLTRLQTIRASLMQRNEPLIARIVELRREFQREQRAVRAQARRQGQPFRQLPLQGGQPQPTARLEEIRLSVQSLLEQIQGNNRAAMQTEVNQLLTPAQRAKLRELVQPRRPGAGRGAGGAGGPGASAAFGG